MIESLSEALARFRQRAEAHWTPEAQQADRDLRKRQRSDRASELRKQSGVPERFASARLADIDYFADTSPAIDAAAGVIDSGFRASLGIYGPVGPGKTTIAAAIVNAACDALIPARMVNAVPLFDAVYAANKWRSRADVVDLMQGLASVPVLLIDDFGKEVMRDRQSLAWLYEMLNERWNACKPLIVTSNLNVDDLTDRYTADCERLGELHSQAFSIMDRLCGLVTQWVELRGASRRGQP